MSRALSEDVTILKARLAEALDALAQRDREIRELSTRIDLLLRRLYGRKSERVHPDQLALAFMEWDELRKKVQVVEEALEAADDEGSTELMRRKTKRNGRVPLPDHLPRERVEHDPAPEDLVCPCCEEPKTRIGEEVTEDLDFRPASLFVRQHVRGKYACRRCEEGVVIGDLPERPIEKGRPGAGLLAQVVVSKYGDHLPLARQSRIFKRQKVEIPRSTLCDWIRDSATLLRPIVFAMKRRILATGYVNTDDTPVRVHMGKGGPGKTREGRIWTYVSPEERLVVYDFTMSRSRDGPARFLEGYEGYLQADAYSGYDHLFEGGRIVEVGCNAHARRKFYEALDTSVEQATLVLAIYRALYDIEAGAKERGVLGGELKELRQEMSAPLLRALKDYLESEQSHALPRSPLGNAIGYALNHWEALGRYVEDGRLSIDNGAAERSLRQVAVGRGNWIFCGSPAGGDRAAVLYSLTTSCRMQGIDPFAYLKDVIPRLSTTPMSRIDELTPSGYEQQHAEADVAAASAA